MLIKPSSKLLKSIATDSNRIPRIYFEGNPIMSYVFWMRLKWISLRLEKYSKEKNKCLNFGGGGGVFYQHCLSYSQTLYLLTLKLPRLKRYVWLLI